MRVTSVLIGFVLAIAVAYGHDAMVSSASADGRPQTIVNWDVFGQAVRDAGVWLREQVDHLTNRIGGGRN